MKSIISYIRAKKIVTGLLVFALTLAMFVLYTPKPVTKDIENSFSAVRAAEHIEVISRKPHSYYDRVELKEVRDYIVNTLATYLGNENVKEFTYDVETIKTVINEDVEYEVTNILGQLPGKNKAGIVLMAHYDSRGHVGRSGELGRSYGAMDDGYGVSTMLEIANILQKTNNENTIYFLFTDAEEVGLYGAKLASKEQEILDNAKFIINLESRGRYGATYMFETSKNNAKVIDLYKKANLPVSYSLATAVYSVMPNYTDFTPMINANIPGVNFATLSGLDNYHSPLDRYENINLSSIQHMGTQVEPIVRAFVSDSKYINDDYFVSKTDSVFFTILPNVFVTYSQLVAIILAVVITIGFVLVLVLGIKEEKIDKTIIKQTLPKGILLTVLLILAGYVASNVIAFLGKTAFSLTYTRVFGADFTAFILLFGITLVFIVKVLKSSAKNDNAFIIGLGLNTLLTILTTFVLPGTSFLFAITALFGLTAYFVDRVGNKYVRTFGLFIAYTVNILLILPLIYSFYMALTVGGLAILVLLLIINGTVLVPIIKKSFV